MSIRVDGILGIESLGNITTANSFIGDGGYISNINAANINFANTSSNVIPAANITYSLGNSTNQWKELWVGSNTIYFSNVPLTINSSNTLLINSNAVVVASNTATPVTANIATTANVIAGNVVIATGGNLVYPDGSTQDTAYSNTIANSYLSTYTGDILNANNITVSTTYTANNDIVSENNISVAGNVYGNDLVAYSAVIGTLTTANQPNITQVGTLTTLDAGNITANLSLIHI